MFLKRRIPEETGEGQLDSSNLGELSFQMLSGLFLLIPAGDPKSGGNLRHAFGEVFRGHLSRNQHLGR